MSEKNGKSRQIDYIFARYPLWVRYSKLPGVLGPGPWCVFQRLLELMERFGSANFHYSLERLCETSGVTSRLGIRKILKKLETEELLKYETQQGRGKEARFEILLPLKTPLSEEDVYHIHPRLRSKAYQKKLEISLEKDHNVTLLDDKKDHSVTLLGGEKDHNVALLHAEKDHNVTLFGNNVTLLAKNAIPECPITTPKEEGQKNAHDKDKKILDIKRQQQQKDLFSTIVDQQNSAGTRQSQTDSDVVAALNAQMLKEYGIAGEEAEQWLRTFSKKYLVQKIEILEYKKYCGESIRNQGGMLKKAVLEDWQAPDGFSTRARREENARREREAEEAAARTAREKKEQERMDREQAHAAEEWKKTAPREIRETIREQARQAVTAEMPDIEERFLRVPIRLRENKIIAERYLAVVKDRGG